MTDSTDNDLIRRGDAVKMLLAMRGPVDVPRTEKAVWLDEAIDRCIQELRDMDALAALPAVAAPGVRVRELEWHNFDAWTYWAEGACGTYHIEERNGYWQVELRVGGLVHGVTDTDDTTPEDLDAAWAAAQADYEARILASLTPNPVPDAVQALVKAAQKVVTSYWQETDGTISGIYDLERALAALTPNHVDDSLAPDPAVKDMRGGE